MALMKILGCAAAFTVVLLSGAQASDNAAMDKDVLRIAESWAHIKYQVSGSGPQLDAIDALSKDAALVVLRYPGRAEPLVWDGIVNSEEAALASAFTALSYAKAARSLFEKAGTIDASVLHGAVPMSLGTLYYRVPGFPIAFGDNDKARRYLEQALAMDPDGLDANYFYGDFLLEQGERDKARQILAHGLNAAVNPDRPIWDAGRRREIRELLATIDKRTASAH